MLNNARCITRKRKPVPLLKIPIYYACSKVFLLRIQFFYLQSKQGPKRFCLKIWKNLLSQSPYCLIFFYAVQLRNTIESLRIGAPRSLGTQEACEPPGRMCTTQATLGLLRLRWPETQKLKTSVGPQGVLGHQREETDAARATAQ